MNATLTTKEQAQKLYDDFSVIFHPLYHDMAIHVKGEKFQIRCKQAKECALVAAKTHIYSENNSPFNEMENWKEDNKYWNEVISEIDKIEMPTDKKDEIKE